MGREPVAGAEGMQRAQTTTRRAQEAGGEEVGCGAARQQRESPNSSLDQREWWGGGAGGRGGRCHGSLPGQLGVGAGGAQGETERGERWRCRGPKLLTFPGCQSSSCLF